MTNTDEEPMVKNGRVEVGKTPSVLSGKPSEMIKKGEAITKDEKDLEVADISGGYVAVLEQMKE